MDSLFVCHDVDYGWEDNATPDGLTVELQLDRTRHEFYPALRELVLLYDAVQQRRQTDFAIGTADTVGVTFPEAADDLVELDLAPVHVHVDQTELSESLESLLTEVFEIKSQMSSDAQRAEGLDRIQMYLDDHGERRIWGSCISSLPVPTAPNNRTITHHHSRL